MGFGTILSELGLELKTFKVRIVHLREDGEGFDFLGFHYCWVHSRVVNSRHFTYQGRRSSRKEMQHARDRIHEMMVRRRMLLPVEKVVEDVNRFLRGWAGYFRWLGARRVYRWSCNLVQHLYYF